MNVLKVFGWSSLFAFNRNFSGIRLLALAALAFYGAILSAPGFAAAEDAKAGGTSLSEQRLEELEQKILVIERKRELEQEESAKKAKESPVIGAGKDGFFLRSADNDFLLRIGGIIQADGRFFSDEPEGRGVNSILLRRVRPDLQGKVFKYFDFRLTPDFAEGKTVLQYAYLGAAILPEARLRVGKFKTPFGLERLQAAESIKFVERALPNDLVPNRDLGAQLDGDIGEGTFSYALGVFNGVPDGGSVDGDINKDKDFAGRIFIHPFIFAGADPLKRLGLGVAGTYGSQEGTGALPSFKTIGQQTFFSYNTGATADGLRYRFSPQAYYYWGSLGFLSEYVYSSQRVKKGTASAVLENDAWQSAASYILTGEEASYKGVKPRQSFNLDNGTWGAVELAARYSELDVDDDAFRSGFADPTKSSSKAEAWGVGVNWYLSAKVKFALQYEQTDFEGGGSRGDRQKEKVVQSRFQIVF